MNFVEPIRDQRILRDISEYLKKRCTRDYIMFLFGIYTGRRISDILLNRVADLRGKDYINIRETKTRKQIILPINQTLKKELNDFLADKKPDEYVFKSRNGYNKPIDRTTAYKILTDAARQFGLERIGTHTLRKTFGYHFYMATKDVVTLMAIFNHSHPSVTLRYIGINQDNINEAIKKLHFF